MLRFGALAERPRQSGDGNVGDSLDALSGMVGPSAGAGRIGGFCRAGAVAEPSSLLSPLVLPAQRRPACLQVVLLTFSLTSGQYEIGDRSWMHCDWPRCRGSNARGRLLSRLSEKGGLMRLT